MAAGTRIATLDAVRGFAVMGILLLNIVDFAMPGYAYIDPHYYGGADGANWWTWATVYILADGKMRGLFTMMFGASTVLIAERAVASGESPARVHYARMASLFVIGMIHAYLIWAGDILVLYSVCGAAMFAFWRLRPRVLLAIGVGLLVVKLALGMSFYGAVGRLEAAAQAPGAAPPAMHAWQKARTEMAPPPESAVEDLKAYRGNWLDAYRARASFAWVMQTQIAIISIPDTLALIAIGMALYRLGFFSGQWSRQRYAQVVVAGLATLPFYVLLVRWIESTHFSPVTLLATEAIQLSVLRPSLSLAWASVVILFVQSGNLGWLAERLAATGRMAFSNYLGTSIVATLIFNGYGLGWFGYLERWTLYPVVAGFWLAMLLWSKPWLARFRYGPLEWAWRSLARWRFQPMLR